MTREVAEKIARGIIDKIECNTADIDDWAEFWGFTREEYEEFLDLAIKALEQEPIIDKIRAEMKPYTDPKGFIVIGENRFNMILDRCKAESEADNG